MKARFWIRFTTLAVVAVVAALVLTGALRPPSLTEWQIGQAYRRLDGALLARNLPAYMSMLTPDYSEMRMTEKPVDRAQAQERYRRIMQDWTFRRQYSTILRIQHAKGSVVAIVDRHSEGTITDSRGVFGPRGRKHAMQSTVSDVDTWVHTPDGWKMKERRFGLATIAVDGRRLGMPIVANDND